MEADFDNLSHTRAVSREKTLVQLGGFGEEREFRGLI
jgi:hypothetical protein